jgi:large subunit ribosomal protein L25
MSPEKQTETSFTDLRVVSREHLGSGASGRLRKDGMVPATITGCGKDAMHIAVDGHFIEMLYLRNKLITHTFNLTVDGKEAEKVVVRDIQVKSLRKQVLHIDLQRISGKEPVKVRIALYFINSSKSIDIKRGATLNAVMRSMLVLCSPSNIVDEIEIDASHMKVGDCMYVSDIKFPDTITPLVPGDRQIARVIGSKGKMAKADAAAA